MLVRIWDKTSERMLYLNSECVDFFRLFKDGAWELCTETCSYEAFPEALVDDQSGILMWGCEMGGQRFYVGDVVEIDIGAGPFIATVEFEAGCFVVNNRALRDSKPELKYYIGMDFCECRVVGNIYENPELTQE